MSDWKKTRPPPDIKRNVKEPVIVEDERFQIHKNLSSSSSLNNKSIKSTNDLPDVKSPYGSISHGVRKIIPHEMACKLGCKGKKCKYDNSDWPPEEMVIPGIFSHWITDEILAMARPRDNLIRDTNFMDKIKDVGIRSIFNLQTRFEHKDCGDGIIEKTGFSYDPMDFEKSNIYYYNFELEDFSVGSIAKMLDMVKVFDFAISEGKVAVHCHAGLGRTGLLIACYLIYSLRMTANEAIHFVREKRPNSVQMNDQIQAVKDFEKYLKPLRTVYYRPISYLSESLNLECDGTNNYSSFNLHTFLHRQRIILHGQERKKFKYIPKIIFICGERLKKLIQYAKSNDAQLESYDREKNTNGFKRDAERRDLNSLSRIIEALSIVKFPQITMKKVNYYQDIINENNEAYLELSKERDPFVISALIWSWLDHLKEPVLRDQEINILLNNFSEKSSNFDSINWNGLDRGTLHTLYYLIGLLHELVPLEDNVKNNLISQLIACLTQTKLKEKSEINDDLDHVLLLNTTKKLKKNNYLILKSALIYLIDNKPVLINESTSIKNKKGVRYDYEEKVYDDKDDNEYAERRYSSRRRERHAVYDN